MRRIRIAMLGPSLSQQGGMATVENLIVGYENDALDIQHISIHEEGSAWHRLWVFVTGLWQFLGQLILNQIEIVHLHVSERGSVFRVGLLVLLANLFAKPVIVHTHGCEFHVFYENLPSWMQFLVRLIFQNCNCVITLSQSWREYYISKCQLDPKRVVVMLNPVELPIPQTSRSRSPQERLTFILLGRIGQRKGAFDTIQAVAQLPPEQRQQVMVWLAGDGEVAQAKSMVENLGLEDSVQLLGWIDRSTRDRLLSQADVFLLPSYNEGLPVSMVEAMAWSLPVIVTPVGGIPELVTHDQQGFLVTPGKVEEIAQAMQTLLQDESLRLSMGRAARQQVSTLDIAPYHQQLAQLYAREVFEPGRDPVSPVSQPLSRKKA
jgi:glycosyltransferase involved in cell wall biosynthesis